MDKIAKKQPLYDQLVDLLKEKIENELKPDSMLPSERELADQYALSRTTVRLALQELEKMGYIYRQHGKGTFVSDLSNKALNLVGAYSFTEQMRALGKKPKTEVLDFKIVEANKYFAKNLQVKLGEPLVKIKRLRLADDMPMMVERSYLPRKIFMTLRLEDLEEMPLYDLFSKRFNQTIKLAEEEFYASIAVNKDAEQLNINENSPSLNLVRTTYNDKNEVVEFTLSVARADQFHYKIVHVR